jgi:hypothetical protein
MKTCSWSINTTFKTFNQISIKCGVLYYNLVGGSNFCCVLTAQNLCEMRVNPIFIDFLEIYGVRVGKTGVTNFTLCYMITRFIGFQVSSAAGEEEWYMNDIQSID